MALLFLLLSAFCAATAQQTSSPISIGSSLTADTNTSWLSSSKLFAFGFYEQGDGFAVGIWFTGILGEKVVWTANRNDQPVSRNATTDGRLILLKTQGQEESIAEAFQSASSASKLDSGNFVLYNFDSKIIWQSFNFPTDTLLSGQQLQAGKVLISSASKTDHSTGRFQLIMQQDGNLVQYPIGIPDSSGSAYWASGTYGT